MDWQRAILAPEFPAETKALVFSFAQKAGKEI